MPLNTCRHFAASAGCPPGPLPRQLHWLTLAQLAFDGHSLGDGSGTSGRRGPLPPRCRGDGSRGVQGALSCALLTSPATSTSIEAFRGSWPCRIVDVALPVSICRLARTNPATVSITRLPATVQNGSTALLLARTNRVRLSSDGHIARPGLENAPESSWDHTVRVRMGSDCCVGSKGRRVRSTERIRRRAALQRQGGLQ